MTCITMPIKRNVKIRNFSTSRANTVHLELLWTRFFSTHTVSWHDTLIGKHTPTSDDMDLSTGKPIPTLDDIDLATLLRPCSPTSNQTQRPHTHTHSRGKRKQNNNKHTHKQANKKGFKLFSCEYNHIHNHKLRQPRQKNDPEQSKGS